jgi:hypothetical protein
MAKFRVPHHFEAVASQAVINPAQPGVATVYFDVDHNQQQLYETYGFSMKRAGLEDLRDRIDRALTGAPLPARKKKASP